MAKKKDVKERSASDNVVSKDVRDRKAKIASILGDSGMTMLDIKNEAKTPRISTGILGLDEATSGGLMEGKVTEFFGEEQSGKSLASLLAIAEAQRQGKYCVFFDVEYGFDQEWAHKLGVNTDPEYFAIPDIKVDETKEDEIIQIMTAEKIFDSICKLAQSRAVGLIVVDSIAAMIPAEEYEGEIEDQKYAALAKVIKKGIGRAVPLLAKSGTSLIIINQVRDTIGAYIKSVHTPGGRTLKHLLSTRIMFSKAGSGDQIKEDESVKGINVRCKVIKHRGGPNFRPAEFRLWYETGFDKEYDLLSYLISKGQIVREGAMYRFGDKSFRGEDAILKALKEDVSLFTSAQEIAKTFVSRAKSAAIAKEEEVKLAEETPKE